jgi:hypothetical protein
MNAREVVGVQEVDLAIDKQDQALGLYTRLVRIRHDINRKEGIAFKYGFSTAETSIIGQKIAGFQKLTAIPRLVKVLDVEPLLRQKFPVKGVIRWLSPLVNGALKLAHPIPKGLPPEGIELKEIKRFDKRFDRFWERIKGDYPIMAVKNSAFLNWRYIDIPHMAYRAISIQKKENAEILGFIVLGEEKRDFPRGQIVDLITPRNADSTISRTLLVRAVDHFRRDKRASIACWMLSHCHPFPELATQGFRPREKKGKDLLFENRDLEVSQIPLELASKQENWYVSIGDSDFD